MATEEVTLDKVALEIANERAPGKSQKVISAHLKALNETWEALDRWVTTHNTLGVVWCRAVFVLWRARRAGRAG